MIFATTLMQHFWPIWTVWIVAFLIVEFTALALRSKYPDMTNNGGTLSELVWWIVRGKAWWHHVLFVVLLTFFVSLGFHFFAGTNLFIIY